MRFMMLIYSVENEWNAMTEEEQAEAYVQFGAFHDEITRRGIVEHAIRVEDSTNTKVVRVRGGKPLVTDGPYAETKEQMGGIYVFNLKDMDEAIEIAAMVPSAYRGAVEIRPVFEDPAMEDEN